MSACVGLKWYLVHLKVYHDHVKNLLSRGMMTILKDIIINNKVGVDTTLKDKWKHETLVYVEHGNTIVVQYYQICIYHM